MASGKVERFIGRGKTATITINNGYAIINDSDYVSGEGKIVIGCPWYAKSQTDSPMNYQFVFSSGGSGNIVVYVRDFSGNKPNDGTTFEVHYMLA